jgi:hypothetical protein
MYLGLNLMFLTFMIKNTYLNFLKIVLNIFQIIHHKQKPTERLQGAI